MVALAEDVAELAAVQIQSALQVGKDISMSGLGQRDQAKAAWQQPPTTSGRPKPHATDLVVSFNSAGKASSLPQQSNELKQPPQAWP
jgi:hypothetical protein